VTAFHYTNDLPVPRREIGARHEVLQSFLIFGQAGTCGFQDDSEERAGKIHEQARLRMAAAAKALDEADPFL
jgi:hypothetical protein